ncbi:MAG: tRNA (adenosine(37)-N6)-dimethylallyltransferase MiaA [Clostridium sp.]|nr:tRNA (adenosine(37)-N6)-dimethylallyltransferase MiaA [Prevotella sp.]MCM1429354.1 tRNA (adenosine(37)-N6)-dimethylallyltransferase MiaA [Clostridium sp.]MCM1475611.1 tRNA (adenosine(37)-N6)-dimethylallyltransferase MiaA [Muribaculaceae bacterium]
MQTDSIEVNRLNQQSAGADRQMIVITGPTASGKSALAIAVARELKTEIISADSRQIYTGLPIVTAQPSAEELSAVPHHLIGTLPPDSYFSASEFERTALEISERLWGEGKIPVVCGGSMMYVDALCNGIDELPTVTDQVRQALMQEHHAKGNDWLLGELERLDPEYYKRVDKQNTKRVFHAVEISIQASKPYSSMLTGRKKQREFRIKKYALQMERQKLFHRINERVERMVSAGLIDEIRNVMEYRDLNSLNTVGVKEILKYLDGEMTLEGAILRLQKNTRVYAKKQLTWLKRDPEIVWLDATLPIKELTKIIVSI